MQQPPINILSMLGHSTGLICFLYFEKKSSDSDVNQLTSESLFHFRPPPKIYQNLNNFDPGRVPVDFIQYFDL